MSKIVTNVAWAALRVLSYETYYRKVNQLNAVVIFTHSFLFIRMHLKVAPAPPYLSQSLSVPMFKLYAFLVNVHFLHLTNCIRDLSKTFNK